MNFEFSLIILSLLSISLVAVIFAILLSKSFLSSIILMSCGSILLALSYLVMDAPDVCMTEVAIGASLSTILMLKFLETVGEDDFVSSRKLPKIMGLIISIIFFALMTYAICDVTPYGQMNDAFHDHISKYYIENTQKDIGVESFVAAILASYRGYDTLGETTVILLSAIALRVILNHNKSSDIERVGSKSKSNKKP